MAEIHVTKIVGVNVYGHALTHCDEAGCACTPDSYYKNIDACGVEAGGCYELDEYGVVIAELF